MKFVLFLSFLFVFSICQNLKGRTLLEENVIAIINSDDELALRNATKKLWKTGGFIYIDTPVITITKQAVDIGGSLGGGIIGVKLPNGQYPRFDCKPLRKKYSGYSCLDIAGNNLKVQNLILENAPSYGIFVAGKNNIIDHVITRYNGESGIYANSQSDYNTFNYCYSYRNFLMPNMYLNKDGDGFTIQLNSFNNKFNYCFAWDNSKSGFNYYNYLFSQSANKYEDFTYSHSASWNNGNMDVFSGKYDFDNGRKLDKNLFTIQEILESDKNFENNYNNKIFNLGKAIINNTLATELFSNYDAKARGIGQCGFVLGSSGSHKSLKNRRTADYCVSFDHQSKGFNNNDSKNFTSLFSNCVGFNNNKNYELPYTFTKWSNNWGWNSKLKDIFNNDFDFQVKAPKDTKSAQREFYSVRDKIISAVEANTFPDVNFDKVIKSLNE